MATTRPKPLATTPFSDFIRNASPAEKQRVYSEVMKKVAVHQSRILARAAKVKKLAAPTPAEGGHFLTRLL
jgi:hypothetical protein